MTDATTAPRKRRRVFWWIFAVLQLVFLLWIITGATSGAAPCHGLTARACADAADTGHGIALALQLVIWCIADFLVGVPYAIWRLARRP